jgi:hypothetical protein
MSATPPVRAEWILDGLPRHQNQNLSKLDRLGHQSVARLVLDDLKNGLCRPPVARHDGKSAFSTCF